MFARQLVSLRDRPCLCDHQLVSDLFMVICYALCPTYCFLIQSMFALKKNVYHASDCKRSVHIKRTQCQGEKVFGTRKFYAVTDDVKLLPKIRLGEAGKRIQRQEELGRDGASCVDGIWYGTFSYLLEMLLRSDRTVS